MPPRVGGDGDRGHVRAFGEWLYDVGLPGKSGIGGGIVTVSPGKGGLGSFSPRLDRAGNSVRGVQAAARLASGSDSSRLRPVRSEASRRNASSGATKPMPTWMAYQRPVVVAGEPDPSWMAYRPSPAAR